MRKFKLLMTALYKTSLFLDRYLADHTHSLIQGTLSQLISPVLLQSIKTE